MTDKINL